MTNMEIVQGLGTAWFEAKNGYVFLKYQTRKGSVQ